MAKVLLTHSYFLYLDPKQLEATNAYPPLGTLYAAAMLRENGMEVIFFDSMLAGSPVEVLPLLANERPDYLVVYDDGFNYLTKMCLTNMREAAWQLLSLGKEAGCKTIISSSDSTDHYEKYLDNGADFVILGEGEQTLLDLLQTENAQTQRQEIQGLAFRNETGICVSARRPVMKDLNLLPAPAWDLVDIDRYKTLWNKKLGYFSLNLVTTRGCTYKCNWCAKPLFGNRYHARSPENVWQELKLLVENFGADQIWFCDDIFGLKPGWIKAFANLVVAHNLHFRFKIQSRADLLVHEETVIDLARAGCEVVWMGAESGSQKILDAMDKGITLAQIREATRLLKKHGIQVAFFLQLGYPGENETDIESTVQMVKDLLPDEIGISVSYPLPGTLLYEKVKSDLSQKANWTDSDDLAMMFKNTYPAPFYKHLQRHIHMVYRREKSLNRLQKLFSSPLKTTGKDLYSALKALYWVPVAAIRRTSLKRLIAEHGSSV